MPDYNWKTFIEVYLEDYHVAPFHPGLGGFVTCDDLRWEFGAHHSVQTVGNRRWPPRLGGLPALARALLPTGDGERRRTARDLADLLPHHHGRVVPARAGGLHAVPQGAAKTLNMVEFYYPEEIAAFEREFVEAEQAAYMETCEDDEIGERMDAGRRALMERGDDEVGPYQSPMEDGMQHFHEWYRGVMGDRRATDGVRRHRVSAARAGPGCARPDIRLARPARPGDRGSVGGPCERIRLAQMSAPG